MGENNTCSGARVNGKFCPRTPSLGVAPQSWCRLCVVAWENRDITNRHASACSIHGAQELTLQNEANLWRHLLFVRRLFPSEEQLCTSSKVHVLVQDVYTVRRTVRLILTQCCFQTCRIASGAVSELAVLHRLCATCKVHLARCTLCVTLQSRHQIHQPLVLALM